MLFRFATLAIVLAVLVPAGIQADTESAQPTTPAAGSPSLQYRVEIKPRNTNALPWTGDLTIRINPEGIINGTYRSTSIRPDPFRGNIITVTGGLSGNNIRLDFGISGNFPVRGEYYVGEGIVGTANSRIGGGSGTTSSLTRPPTVTNPRSPTVARTPAPMSTTTLYDFVALQQSK